MGKHRFQQVWACTETQNFLRKRDLFCALPMHSLLLWCE